MKARGFSLSLFALSALAIGFWTSGSAHSQGGGVKNVLWLQGSTPGISQSGHSNLSGTMRAGQFVGSGTGLTAVPAGSLTGILNVSAIPVPLQLTGSIGSIGIVTGTNTSASAGASGLKGEATAVSGFTNGVLGVNASSSGRGIFGYSTASTGTTYGMYGRSDSASGTGVYALASATTGTNYGLYASASSSTGYAIYAEHTSTTGSTTGIYSVSEIPNGHSIWGVNNSTSGTAYGVGGDTFSNIGRAVVGRANSPTGTTYGVFGFNQSTSGRGVFGTATANTGTNYGVRGESDSTSGYGVYGTSPNVGVAGVSDSYGVYGDATSTNAFAIYGRNLSAGDTVAILGIAQSNTGTGIKGQGGGSASASGIWGVSPQFGRGVFGEAYGAGGVGVEGNASVAIKGLGSATGVWGYGYVRGMIAQTLGQDTDQVGVEGRTYTNGSSGVLGSIEAVANQTGGIGYGVYGLTNRTTDRAVLGDSDSTTGSPYGVFGDTDGVGIAVYAAGNMSASGTKAFRIDHPLDPANKYLYHYSTESPEPMNFYSGNVTTGSNGYAWVDLPDYFESINTDLRYQLTVIDDSDDFVLAKVTKEASNGRFQVRTNKPGVKVSWRVEALRNDAYVRHYRPVKEEFKPEQERGLYDHPEIFGFGRELSQQHDQPAYEGRLKASDDRLSGKDKRTQGQARKGGK